MEFKMYTKLRDLIETKYEQAETIELEDKSLVAEFALDDYVKLQQCLLSCVAIDLAYYEEDGDDGEAQPSENNNQQTVVNFNK